MIETVDDYIAQFSKDLQEKLQAIRQAIKETAPQATEKYSWKMASYYLNGTLVHFAAFKNHIGFYPGASGAAAFVDKLSEYKTSKGAIQFPLNKPIPFDLITEIVKFRVKESCEGYSK